MRASAKARGERPSSTSTSTPTFLSTSSSVHVQVPACLAEASKSPVAIVDRFRASRAPVFQVASFQATSPHQHRHLNDGSWHATVIYPRLATLRLPRALRRTGHWRLRYAPCPFWPNCSCCWPARNHGSRRRQESRRQGARVQGASAAPCCDVWRWQRETCDTTVHCWQYGNMA